MWLQSQTALARLTWQMSEVKQEKWPQLNQWRSSWGREGMNQKSRLMVVSESHPCKIGPMSALHFTGVDQSKGLFKTPFHGFPTGFTLRTWWNQIPQWVNELKEYIYTNRIVYGNWPAISRSQLGVEGPSEANERAFGQGQYQWEAGIMRVSGGVN